MRPLKDVVVALHHELEAAFQASQGLPDCTPMQVDRVVLTLEVALWEEDGSSSEQGLRVGVLVAGKNPAVGEKREPQRIRTHSLSIELKPRAR